jgi:hypothetical protein
LGVWRSRAARTYDYVKEPWAKFGTGTTAVAGNDQDCHNTTSRDPRAVVRYCTEKYRIVSYTPFTPFRADCQSFIQPSGRCSVSMCSICIHSLTQSLSLQPRVCERVLCTSQTIQRTYFCNPSSLCAPNPIDFDHSNPPLTGRMSTIALKGGNAKCTHHSTLRRASVISAFFC